MGTDADEKEMLVGAQPGPKKPVKDKAYHAMTFAIGVMMVVTGSLNTLAARMADLVTFDSDSCIDKFDWPPRSHASEVGATQASNWKPQYVWPNNDMCPGDQPDDPPLAGAVLTTAHDGIEVNYKRTQVDVAKDGYDKDGESLPVDFEATLPYGHTLALAVWPCGGDGRAGQQTCNNYAGPTPDDSPVDAATDEAYVSVDKRNVWSEYGVVDVMLMQVDGSGKCQLKDMYVEKGTSTLMPDTGRDGCKDNLIKLFSWCEDQPGSSTVKVTMRRVAETKDTLCDNRLPEHGFFHYALKKCAEGFCEPTTTDFNATASDRVMLLPEDAYGSICPDQDFRCSFNHPFFQADLMFLGEFFCLIAYFVCLKIYPEGHDKYPGKPSPGFNPVLFAIPATCDMCATGLMYVGLTLIYSSIFQMIRGSVVVFTMLFTFIILKRKPSPFQYVACFLIIFGLAMVGIATFIGKSSGCGAGSDPGSMLLGIILILTSQICQGFQMVVEEKFLGNYEVPALLAVGLEGCWGMLFISLLIIPFHWIETPFAPSGVRSWPTQYLEDLPNMGKQIACNPIVVLPLLGTSVSIAFFNFAGMSITKRVSATVRMVLDSIRTAVIWAVSMILHPVMENMQGFDKLQFGWQAFGFVILLMGIAQYNRLLQCTGLEPPFSEAVPDGAQLLGMRREQLLILATRMGLTAEDEESLRSDAESGGGDPDQLYMQALVRWVEQHKPDGEQVEAGDGEGRSVRSRAMSDGNSSVGLGKLQMGR